MLEDFSLSDKSELFPLNPVSGSSTFSSSTSCNKIDLKICFDELNVAIKGVLAQKIVKVFARSSFVGVAVR